MLFCSPAPEAEVKSRTVPPGVEGRLIVGGAQSATAVGGKPAQRLSGGVQRDRSRVHRNDDRGEEQERRLTAAAPNGAGKHPGHRHAQEPSPQYLAHTNPLPETYSAKIRLSRGDSFPRTLRTGSRMSATHDKSPVRALSLFPKMPSSSLRAQRFEEQAAGHPDALAVTTTSRQLTYDQLNQAANRLANTMLAQRGSVPEPIGLLFADDADYVIAVLATLKAGKTFVPLDAHVPVARLAGIVEELSPGLVLCDPETRTMALQWLTPDRILGMDTVSTATQNPAPCAADLSHILYTSGSTGRPKGVMHRPRNLMAYTCSTTNAPASLRPIDSVLPCPVAAATPCP